MMIGASLQFGQRSRGSLQIASTPAIRDLLLEGGELLRRTGVPMTLLPTAADVVKLEPSLAPVADRIAGGICSDLGMHLWSTPSFILRLINVIS